MYDQIGEEVNDAGVAETLDAPVWMDKTGKLTDENDVFSCKVDHKITRLGLCLVVDEVGGNTNQKDYGNVRGELQLCESGKMPQQKINTKDKQYTLLSFAFTSEPDMRTHIFRYKRTLHCRVQPGSIHPYI